MIDAEKLYWENLDKELNKEAIARERVILSRLRQRDIIWSMAQVADLKDFSPEDDVPILERGGQVGVVKVPRELFRLKSFGRGVLVNIWYLTDAHKQAAFKVSIRGGFDVSAVEFNWGIHTGMLDLTFICFGVYKCKVPEKKEGGNVYKFGVDSLVELLTNGDVKQFVLDNGTMSNAQKEIIRKRGL